MGPLNVGHIGELALTQVEFTVELVANKKKKKPHLEREREERELLYILLFESSKGTINT